MREVFFAGWEKALWPYLDWREDRYYTLPMTRLPRLPCLFFLIAVLVSPLVSCNASPSLSPTEYERALERAQKDGKPIMLYFSSKYCPYCTLMEEGTLADKEIRGILAGFHVVKIDGERNTGLTRRYSVGMYPSFWFLEGSGKRILEVPGYMEKPRFKRILEYVKGNHYKTQDFYRYMKKPG